MASSSNSLTHSHHFCSLCNSSTKQCCKRTRTECIYPILY